MNTKTSTPRVVTFLDQFWREKILERDDYTCQRCGFVDTTKGANLHAHHILSWASRPDLRQDMSNGQTLCPNCHADVHGNTLQRPWVPIPLSTDKKLPVRVPEDIAAELRQLAAAHDRSFNGEIVRALREYVQRQKEGKRQDDKA